jgi:hypothetical protein
MDLRRWLAAAASTRHRRAPGGRTIGGRATIALCVLASPAGAQGLDDLPGIEGVWIVRWAQGIRTDGSGAFEVRRWGEARLALEVDGDSVTGRWTTRVDGETTWPMTGTFRDGVLRLSSPGHDSTDPQLAALGGIELTGRLEHGRLEGTLQLSIRGRVEAPEARPWSAERREGLRPH